MHHAWNFAGLVVGYNSEALEDSFSSIMYYRNQDIVFLLCPSAVCIGRHCSQLHRPDMFSEPPKDRKLGSLLQLWEFSVVEKSRFELGVTAL